MCNEMIVTGFVRVSGEGSYQTASSTTSVLTTRIFSIKRNRYQASLADSEGTAPAVGLLDASASAFRCPWAAPLVSGLANPSLAVSVTLLLDSTPFLGWGNSFP